MLPPSPASGRRRPVVAALLFATATLLGAGCSGRDSGLTSTSDGDPGSPAQTVNLRAPQSVDDWARALAEVLVSPDQREFVATALRSSNLTEHKVLFKRLLVDPQAGRFQLALARALHLNGPEFQAAVNALPDLDFYMLAKSHRHTWLPEHLVIVAAQMGNHPPAVAYDTNGDQVPLRLEAHELPQTALLFLQAAEPKQVMPVSRVAASRFIEHPAEFRGRGVILASAECNPETDPEGCEGGNGGGGPGSSCSSTDYRLKSVATYGLVDNNNPFETNEIEVHGDDGSVLDYARVTEVGITDVVSVDKRVICSDASVIFATKETDGIFNPDDDFTLPFPNTSKWFNLTSSQFAYLYNWPDHLDPLYNDPKVRIMVQW